MKTVKGSYASLASPTGRGWGVGTDPELSKLMVRRIRNGVEVVRCFVGPVRGSYSCENATSHLGIPPDWVTSHGEVTKFGAKGVEFHSISPGGAERHEGWVVPWGDKVSMLAACVVTRHATRRDEQRIHECFDSIKLRSMTEVLT